ncbi:MAG: DUF4055 domain-containing protein [Gemmatimonadota bacterium]
MPHEKQPNDPSTTGLSHERQAPAVTICRDVYGGTLQMRAKGETYLPRFPREDEPDYDSRLEQAVLTNFFGRTVGGLTGMVFRKPPTLDDDVPDVIREDAENIDLAGRDLATFVRDAFENMETDGHTHIFVDFQRVEEGQFPTLREEAAAGTRPYWVNIKKQDLIRFRAANIGGRMVLTAFAYRERTVEPDGEFGEKEVDTVRDYTLVAVEDERGEHQTRVRFRLFVKQEGEGDDEDKWVEDTSRRTLMSIGRIPLTTAYAKRTAFMESEPPHLDLALENIRHYQLVSDNDNALHIASSPWPVFIGVDIDQEMALGPGRGVKIPDPKGNAKYVEPQGNGLEAAERRIQKSEHRMAILGLSMLMSESRSAETATSKRIDKSESDAALTSHVDDMESAVAEALAFHAEWRGLERGGSVAINRDFETQLITPEHLRELRETVGQGDLSVETMWEILERGELLPGTFDPELEKERLGRAGLDDAGLEGAA